MTDEFARREAIRAEPNDSTPRLVYADWLDNRDDPRAEFLRLELQLAEILDRLQRIRPALDHEWVNDICVRRDVVLHDFPPDRRGEVTKLIRVHTGQGLEQARESLSNLPAVLLHHLPLERAERLRQEFAAVAKVTIEPPARPPISPPASAAGG